MADEIIKELWRIKDEMAREHGYDVRRFAAYIRSREREREAREALATGEGGQSSAMDGRHVGESGPPTEIFWQPSRSRGSSEEE